MTKIKKLFFENTFKLAHGNDIPKIKIPSKTPLVIPPREAVTCITGPSFSMTNTIRTQIIPTTATIPFIQRPALSSVIVPGNNLEMKSSKIVPETVFKYEDMVLENKK